MTSYSGDFESGGILFDISRRRKVASFNQDGIIRIDALDEILTQKFGPYSMMPTIYPPARNLAVIKFSLEMNEYFLPYPNESELPAKRAMFAATNLLHTGIISQILGLDTTFIPDPEYVAHGNTSGGHLVLDRTGHRSVVRVDEKLEYAVHIFYKNPVNTGGIQTFRNISIPNYQNPIQVTVVE